MRFLELRLTAFGPFTDCLLDLRHGREGLHIFYGPNEAGKSSALRAIRCLLYGIPVQTTDNFIHPYAKMRLGAVIGDGTGDTLTFTRHKGKIRTLYDGDDREPLEEEALRAFLGGVDENRFAAMFGIGHDDLVRGGREIIEGGGELGRLVFTAGSGVGGLRDIQAELQAEAGSLFKPSGQNPRINAALGRITTLRQELREANLPETKWAEQDRTLRKAEKRKAALDAELTGLGSELDRLKRIREALPDIAGHKELMAGRDAVSDAIRLPADFPERRRIVEERARNAAKEQNRAAAALAELRREVETLSIPPVLIECAEQVDQAHQDLGSHRKAMKDRRDNETRLSILRGEARELLRGLRNDLTLEQAESLRISKSDAEGIRVLCKSYERLAVIMENARAALPELDRKSQVLRMEIGRQPTPRSVDGLHLAMSEAAECSSLEKQVREEEIEIGALNRSIDGDLVRLGLNAATTATLDTLAPPSEERIAAFEKKTAETDQLVRDRSAEIRTASERLADIVREQDVLRTEQDVPTEDDLAVARAIRDRGWRIVSTRLSGGESKDEECSTFIQEFPDAATLKDAYERSVQAADEIADRLRREADRVGRRAGLMADARALEHRLTKLRADLAGIEQDRNALTGEWMAAWSPMNIVPGTPREMMRWLGEFRGLADKAAALRTRTVRVDTHATMIEDHRRKLLIAMQTYPQVSEDEGERLGSLIRRANGIVETEAENRRIRNQLQKELAVLENDRESAAVRLRESQRDIQYWRDQWDKAVRPLGLDGKALPAQTNVMLEGLRDLFEKIREADVLDKRIQGIDRDAQAFAVRVSALVNATAPDLVGKPVEESIPELHRRLKQAASDSERNKVLEKQLRQEEKRLRQAENDGLEAETDLKSLCAEAGCSHADELPRIEQRAAERSALEADLINVEKRLRLLSGGVPVPEFIMTAQREDPDGLSGRIDGLQECIHELTAEKSGLDQTIGTARNELSRMNGDSRAADIAETIQTALGGLSADVELYARMRIADQVLNMAVERFRQQNQGPILQAASRLFRRITLGAFDGARAVFDDIGRPVIVGERAGGETVYAAAMSDGTADQLYLALRLAGMDAYLETNTPFPFIVDDILIRFDDERASAALGILADLSRKTQVVFFTHHRRLVELAERHVDPAALNVQSIG